MPVRKTSRDSKAKTDNDSSLQADASSDETPVKEEPKEEINAGSGSVEKSAPEERQLFFSTDGGEDEPEISSPSEDRGEDKSSNPSVPSDFSKEETATPANNQKHEGQQRNGNQAKHNQPNSKKIHGRKKRNNVRGRSLKNLSDCLMRKLKPNP